MSFPPRWSAFRRLLQCSESASRRRQLLAVSSSIVLVLAGALVLVACARSAAPLQTSSQATSTKKLAPAPNQPDPTNLWNSQPIPAVSSAVTAVQDNAPLPKTITPSLHQLTHGYQNNFEMPADCQPAFGVGGTAGATSKICRLDDASSKHVVVVIGDSHAGTWMPAIIAAGRAQGFAVISLAKAGCVLTALQRQTNTWPCAQWYQWALAEDHRLHPTATIVSFQLTSADQAQPGLTVNRLRSVLDQVNRGVLLVDSPGQSQQPIPCVTNATATMRTCSSRVLPTYVPLMRDIARMSGQTNHPAIPTLQWFCAKNICPMVIDHTLVLHDLSHMTGPYSDALGAVFSKAFKPIYDQLKQQ